MNWADLTEIFTKWWIAVFIPLAGWLDKKRREFSSLSQKVESLEQEVKHINNRLDEDREEREERRKEDLDYRNAQSQKIDKIHEVLIEVKTATAVNSTKLDERK